MRCKRLIYLGLKPLPSLLALVASFAQPRGQSSSGAQVIRLRHLLPEKRSPWMGPRFGGVHFAQLVPSRVAHGWGGPKGETLGPAAPAAGKGQPFALRCRLNIMHLTAINA
jgi:hypothetical protein